MKNRNKKIFFDQPVEATGVLFNPTANVNVPPKECPSSKEIPTSGFIIPFARGEKNTVMVSTDASGRPDYVVILGGGMNGYVTITDPTNPSFSQTAYTQCYSFIMPCTSILQSIAYTSVAYNSDSLPSASNPVTPFVAIFTAPSGSNAFTLIPGTKVPATTPFTASMTTDDATKGYMSNINVEITAGTRVAVVGGMDTAPGAKNQYFEYAGTLFFSMN